MPKAFIGNVECAVHVDKDLGDSWAVTVAPPQARKGEKQLAPLVVKLQGESPSKIAKGALEILQKRGDITRFEVEPEPEPEAAPAAAAAPAAPATPAAPAAPAPAKPPAKP